MSAYVVVHLSKRQRRWAAHSCVDVCAAPHKAEQTTNIARQRLKTNFLPKISLNLAKITRKPDDQNDKYVDYE